MRINNRLAAAAVMSALFVAGGVTGGALVSALQAGTPSFLRGDVEQPRSEEVRRGDHDGDRGRGRGNPREPRVMSDRAARGLAHRLDLDEGQQDTVRAILERQGQQAGEIFRSMWPELQALMDSANADIRRRLTPEQQAQFDEMVAEDRNLLGRRYRPQGADPGSDDGPGPTGARR